MSEQDERPDTDDAPEAADDRGTWDETRAREKIERANREAANLRKRLKELEPLAAKAKELEDANKSEADKLSERIAAAEKRAADAETKALRWEVAAAKGLNQAQAKRLVGNTKEELETDADELLETFGTGDRKTPPTRRPVENLRGGSEPDVEPEETDPTKLAALHPRGTY